MSEDIDSLIKAIEAAEPSLVSTGGYPIEGFPGGLPEDAVTKSMADQNNTARVSESGKLLLAFDVVELQKISLKPDDILAVKLIGDDFDVDTMNSLRDSLTQVIKNKVMIFTMPRDSDIKFLAIESAPAQNYCSDCSCGKKERAENGETN